MSFPKNYNTLDLSLELTKLSDNALMLIQEHCGDDFTLYDICSDILEARLEKEVD